MNINEPIITRLHAIGIISVSKKLSEKLLIKFHWPNMFSQVASYIILYNLAISRVRAYSKRSWHKPFQRNAVMTKFLSDHRMDESTVKVVQKMTPDEEMFGCLHTGSQRYQICCCRGCCHHD